LNGYKLKLLIHIPVTVTVNRKAKNTSIFHFILNQWQQQKMTNNKKGKEFCIKMHKQKDIRRQTLRSEHQVIHIIYKYKSEETDIILPFPLSVQ
jgi:hypothetical protein